MLSLCFSLALGVISLVYTLRARVAKNALKGDFLKAKGKIPRHVFFSLMCGAVLGSLFGDSGGFSWFGGIFGFGFPFGAVAVGIFAPKAEEDSRDYDRDRSSVDFMFFVMLLLAYILGIVLTPIVIIRDVMSLVKTYRNYKKGIQ